MRWLRIPEVCEAYGISRRTLIRWVELGAPCSKPSGGLLLFDPGALDAWLRTRAAGTADRRKRGRPRKTAGGGTK